VCIASLNVYLTISHACETELDLPTANQTNANSFTGNQETKIQWTTRNSNKCDCAWIWAIIRME